MQVCLNGARTKDDFGALPMTAAELAAEASAAVAAGASDIHLHPKDGDGFDSLLPDLVAAAVTAVRAVVPGWVKVGVTTGSWAEANPERRANLVSSWPVLPDHASVNWHEDGAELVARALSDRGIEIEAGIYSGTGAARHFRAAAWPVLRILAEVTDADPDTGPATALVLLDELGPGQSVPILLHGEDASAWPVLLVAARQGLDARIGLEDVLTLPDGTLPAGNADLVRAAAALIAAHGRPRV